MFGVDPDARHLVSTVRHILLTIINVLGLKRGSALINAATWAKFAAIGIFVLLGLAIGKRFVVELCESACRSISPYRSPMSSRASASR